MSYFMCHNILSISKNGILRKYYFWKVIPINKTRPRDLLKPCVCGFRSVKKKGTGKYLDKITLFPVNSEVYHDFKRVKYYNFIDERDRAKQWRKQW